MGKRILKTVILGLAVAILGPSGSAKEAAPESSPPAIESLLKPAVFKKLTEEREAMVHASLADVPPVERYSFYAAMQVRAGLIATRAVLTDYALYAKMIPYVDQASFDPSTQILHVQGGIWMFKLNSRVQFQERGERWIHFRIVSGHFAGLEGDVFFEAESGRGYPSTLVYMSGAQKGTQWPPRFVIERGAEVVFGFTARRMRDYIESQKNSAPLNRTNGVAPHGTETPRDNSIPQPRSRL